MRCPSRREVTSGSDTDDRDYMFIPINLSYKNTLCSTQKYYFWSAGSAQRAWPSRREVISGLDDGVRKVWTTPIDSSSKIHLKSTCISRQSMSGFPIQRHFNARI